MNKQQYLAQVGESYRPDIVSIDDEAIARLVIAQAPSDTVSVRLPFAHAEYNVLGADSPTQTRALALTYLLAMTSLQYRFWQIDPSTREFLRYSFDGLVGSSGLEKAFFSAWGPNPAPSNALSDAAKRECAVAATFGADLPDIPSRRAILAEVLASRAGREAVREVTDYIAAHNRLDIELASRVADLLPTAYGDPFLKKAMLFLSFVASALRDPRLELDLCAFADYQVPNVMRHHAVLRYSEDLAARVARRELLPRGGVFENAIRSATVLGCEKIAQVHGLSAAGVDWWCFQQRKLPQDPFHLTEGTDY